VGATVGWLQSSTRGILSEEDVSALLEVAVHKRGREGLA
jgi:hypothetical protein